MRIRIRVGTHIPKDAAALLRRRLEFALGRFSARLHQVSARVVDVNGPRGGIDKSCVITLRLARTTRPIVIEDIDHDPMVAIDRAADRAGRTVARALARQVDRSTRAGCEWLTQRPSTPRPGTTSRPRTFSST